MINMFKRLGAFFLDIIEVIVFAVAIFLFVYLLIMQPHKIKGASMHPNFPDGEYLLTDKVSYRFGEPNRGDVVVFKAPTNNGEEFIGEYFVLGDNRSHSSDSRAWGSVEKKEITGRAWLVYWPPKSAGVVVKEKY
ncbi:MAG: Signal peptidase I [Candidatus Woesebacteria bacterium GW2011_GWF1_46_13]|uniref:Signal peptidase I n=1 Tax=Candidatus Woesebacteria bacterium GW2011_GWF1_46_13 TaxID=1618602 RepID=A0A0G1RRD3_9BACT|nr:MAG: Signal peptidase I [Candidatus Woesebacteria bacterium GW2011_GWF1_46_13]